MFATGNRAVLFLLLLASPTAAQEFADEDAPAIHQARPNFYNAVGGRNLKVTWSAEPTTLSVDSELTLTLTVSGAVNPQRVRRPDLAAMPAFKSRFQQITAGTDPPVEKTSPRVTFTYRLRPRDESVRDVPELQYDYYSTATGKPETRYLDAIPLQVTAAAVVLPSPLPLDGPPRLFRLPSEAALQSRTKHDPNWWHWRGLLVAMILAVAGGVAIWRLRNPNGRRFARVRRHRAVRNALDTMDRASESLEPLALVSSALRRYFWERHGLPTVASPGELETAFRAAAIPAERIAPAVELLRKIDAARFGGDSDNALSLIALARELVLTWEGVE
ncbi:BatD family protein [Limnoglobus roseus]|uniref:Protein BatD n=1 Tax=Limnoglobus roseus TaxID=2598579 RepID=A0A5C1AJT0_9BACT|nr:BatD family protein [Limnoglobus roseus]QEL19120.1 hypothetical protein PX52LOC_06177 [Limnoglobus roseus]